MSTGAPELSGVFDLLDRLHRPKSRAYGDAWRKRGEVLGIFANVARKFDRLEVAQAEHEGSPVEWIGDTVADLCVYSGKYVTWLAEQHPAAFEGVLEGASAEECSDARGERALQAVFGALQRRSPICRPNDPEDAFDAVERAFREIESGLIQQAAGAPPLALSEKIRIVATLTMSSVWLLWHLSQRDPALVERLQRDIAAMEGLS